MSDHISTLLKLQAIDFEESTEPNPEVLKTELRNSVPPQILGHYDRLVARGKKGVAIVNNQVCTGCHMKIPIGTINTLMQRNDIQLCDSCGRYLYLPQTAPAAEQPAAAETKKSAKPRKTRKSKALADATA